MAAKANIPANERIYLSETGLTVIGRRHVNEQAPSHIIWFDATGRADMYAELFEREVETVDLRMKMAGRIIQVTDRANGKSALVDQDGNEKDYAKKLKAQIAHIAGQYENPALITFQSIEGSYDGMATEHFYGSRGTNNLQDCDCLIVAGTPQPPLYQVEKTAKAIWDKRSRPFNSDIHHPYIRYNHIDENGDGWEYPTLQFMDPELNIVMWQTKDAEIIQAVHRSRLLFRDVPVYLLCNIPIDELPPSRLITIQELLGAPDGVDAYKWLAVMEFCREKDLTTVSDLTDKFGISRPTANKFMDIMIDSFGFERVEGIREKGKPGKPPKTIKKLIV